MNYDPPEYHECRHCGEVIRATKRVPCVDVRRVVAVAIARRHPVDAGPIYRAIQRYPIDADVEAVIEAAIGRALAEGINPASFAQFLRKGATE